MQIHPNIHCLKGLISICYIIQEIDGFSLIDCGTRRDFKKILKFLTGNSFPSTPIKQILITHADGDHYGAATKIKEICQVRVISSQIEKEAMEKGISSRPLRGGNIKQFIFNLLNPLFSTSPTSVDVTTSEPFTFPILGNLFVLNTPGHTPGHLSYWLREERILFAGDSIWEMNGQINPSRGINCWNEEQARKSFDLQMELSPKIICAGHFCKKIIQTGE